MTETPDYLAYSKQTSFTYNQHFHRATNILLKQDPSVDGLKTGYTKAAGYNLALTANRPALDSDSPERRVVVVVMGTKSAQKRAEVAHTLLNLAYSYTRNEVAIKPKQMIAELPVVKSTLRMFKIESSQPKFVTTSLYEQPHAINLSQFDQNTQRLQLANAQGRLETLEPAQRTQTHVNVELSEKLLTAPLAQVMKLATVHVYQNNQLINSFAIEEHVNIVEANIFERIMMWFGSLFNFFSHQPLEDEQASLG